MIVDVYLRELQVNVNRVEAEDKVDQHGVDTLWHLLQENWCDRVLERVSSVRDDGDQHLLCLLVDITDIYTTFVGKENPVTLSRTKLALRD